jgi:hypothetical protein
MEYSIICGPLIKFLRLKLILQPAQRFEFDMPVLICYVTSWKTMTITTKGTNLLVKVIQKLSLWSVQQNRLSNMFGGRLHKLQLKIIFNSDIHLPCLEAIQIIRDTLWPMTSNVPKRVISAKKVSRIINCLIPCCLEPQYDMFVS